MKSGNDDVLSMLGAVQKQRFQVEQVLLEEYGEWYPCIFQDDNLMDELFQFSDQSLLSLRRRIIIKALTVITDNMDGSPNNQSVDDSKFTWVTAGDASAAGYGNLSHQSYTAILEDTVGGAFKSIGITFRAMNLAIHDCIGSREVMDFSSCMESLYNSDVDILTYDFSIEDLPYQEKQSFLWLQRVLMLPSRPLLLLIDNHDTGRANEQKIWRKALDEKIQKETSVGVGIMDQVVYYSEILMKRVPDSRKYSQKQLEEEIPPGLAYLKCHTFVEGINPKAICEEETSKLEEKPPQKQQCHTEDNHCSNFKWHTMECGEKSMNQNNQHPGWKIHKLKGRLMGMFLLNNLFEALFQLATIAENFGGNQNLLSFASYLLDVLANEDKVKHNKKSIDSKRMQALGETVSSNNDIQENLDDCQLV